MLDTCIFLSFIGELQSAVLWGESLPNPDQSIADFVKEVVQDGWGDGEYSGYEVSWTIKCD
jgi:hypothetical protein